MVLDLRTLIVSGAAVAACILVVLVVVRAMRPVPAGFGAWTLSQGAIAAGAALVATRGVVPDWASVVAANLLILSGLCLLAEGFVRFYALPRRAPAWVDVGVVAVAALLVGRELRGSVNVRIAVFSAACAYFLLRTALEPLASREARRSLPQRAIAAVNTVAAILMLVRAVRALAAPPFAGLWGEGWTAIVPGLLLMGTNLVTMFMALFVCFERSEAQLRAARSEVKTLSGLLPICMQCHKIRNDQGYWDRLEGYIVEHSEAQFTHGLCPECYEEMFRGGDPPGKEQA